MQNLGVPKEKGDTVLLGERQAMKEAGHKEELDVLINSSGHE